MLWIMVNLVLASSHIESGRRKGGNKHSSTLGVKTLHLLACAYYEQSTSQDTVGVQLLMANLLAPLSSQPSAAVSLIPKISDTEKLRPGLDYGVGPVAVNRYTEMVDEDGTQYVAYSVAGVEHAVSEQADLVLEFFGIA